jgi:UDP:flavonoid glycosyltransferase YjiC (YdhE family)
MTALAAGTPALIIPAYSERESNARRAAALGAAPYLVHKPDTAAHSPSRDLPWCPQMGGAAKQLEPKLVADAITILLEDPRYANAAQATAHQLATLPSAADAADIIEALPQPATGSH